MKRKMIAGGIAAVAAGVLLWACPRYALVGIVCLAAGWIGRAVYAKRTVR